MIDIGKTKARILTLAFQGALTASLEKTNDFAALDELHGAIRNYKAVESTEYLIEVPDYWRWSRLGYVTHNHGQTTPTERFSYIDVGTLDNKRQKLSHTENIVEAENAPSRARKIVECGDVLYSTVRPYLHNICIVDKSFSCLPIASTAFCVMATDESILLNTFLFYWLLSSEFDKFANGNPSKGTLYPAIGERALLRGVIPIPPLEEQKRIVEFLQQSFAELQRIDDTQEAFTRDIELFKNSIVDSAIRGDLTAKWRSEHHLSKSEWSDTIINECFDVVGGIQKKPSRTPKDNPVPYVTVANVFRNRIVLSDLRSFEIFDGELEKYQLKAKDILVVEGNGSGGEIGRCAMWENQIPVCVHQNHIIRLRCTDDQVLPEYVLLYLNSPIGQAVVRERAKTTTGLYNLSAGKIRTIPVPLPSLAEQQRIVECVNELIRALPA